MAVTRGGHLRILLELIVHIPIKETEALLTELVTEASITDLNQERVLSGRIHVKVCGKPLVMTRGKH